MAIRRVMLAALRSMNNRVRELASLTLSNMEPAIISV